MDVEKFNEDLFCVFWNVMDSFDIFDEKYFFWEFFFNIIVEKYMFIKRMRFCKVDVLYMIFEWKRVIKMKRKFVK